MREDDLIVSLEPVRRPGGQHVGLMPALVTVKHVPTGLQASAMYGTSHGFRSQHKARTCAAQMIEWGLSELGYVDDGKHPSAGEA